MTRTGPHLAIGSPAAAVEPWYLRFHDLMPFRVREILLVSSPYDAFILEEDGRLTARLFEEYSELNLSEAPRITHAPTAARAMELLGQRWFDMVITMGHLADMDVRSFVRRAKSEFPGKPVVLLTFQQAELVEYDRDTPTLIDRVFLWTGDTNVLIAAIKLIEDQANVAADTRAAGVRVVIVVEDSVRRYSSFLSLLFSELLHHAGSLIAEGVNDLHKRLRMRARPKILLATTFEEALDYYRQYRPYVIGVISDVRFPRDGAEDATAGFELTRILRGDDPDLPVLLQSVEPGLAERAEELEVAHADKNSPHLQRQVREFLAEGLGFGDFIFRRPDRAEVGRARDIYEMEQVLQTVPTESLEYHALRNHFSMWLMARGMFHLAEQLRPRTVEDFDGLEDLRRHLTDVLRHARLQDQQGAITDFSAQQSQKHGLLVRLGQGSIGGKGRSIAFVNSLLVRHGLNERFAGLEIRIPRTVVVGTDEFDLFLEMNELMRSEPTDEEDHEIIARFLQGDLSDALVRNLEVACRQLGGPLAVRSSSMLEDSYLQPFAGIYATYMLPNNHPDPSVRLRQLRQAVKAVYASTFSRRARAYISGTPFSTGDEKMGVVIQEVVGRSHENRYYPHFSGVACSYNYYPIGDQRADEGFAALALGLGHTVVSGGVSLQFSPSRPNVLPQFPTAADFMQHSQSKFYAIDLDRQMVDFCAGPESSLIPCELSVAEADGTLQAVGSVYSVADDTIRDNLQLAGPRVVTFNNILRWEGIPLAPALAALLRLVRRGIGHAVELEFAVDMGNWGQGYGDAPEPTTLYLLQIRPQAMLSQGADLLPQDVPPEQVLCRTDSALGHGVIEDVRDVVYVRTEALERISTKEVAEQVGHLNGELSRARRPYMLIGPGRWGSSDASLGIPVEWSQISGVRVMVETSFDNRAVEPSQGSHFFHNMTAMGIGYLTLSGPTNDWTFDWDWLRAQTPVSETDVVRHVRLDDALKIYLDGRRSRALVFKPEA